MNVFVVITVWLGCLAPYQASQKNRLNNFQLPKFIAWGSFVALQSLSVGLLHSSYGFVSACLVVLALIMCMWPLLVLSSPYFKHKSIFLNAVAVIFFTLIALTGIFYEH